MKIAVRSGEAQEALCDYSTRETNNGGGTRARILNRKGKWFNHSYLSRFGRRAKHARCERVRIHRLRPHLYCSSPKSSAKTLSQQENNNKADLRRGRVKTSDYICTVANNSRGDAPSTILCQRPQPCGGRTKSSQVKLILSPKQRAKPAVSRSRACANAAVCIASGKCPSRF